MRLIKVLSLRWGCFVLPVSLVFGISVPLISNGNANPEGPGLMACGERPAGSRSAAPEPDHSTIALSGNQGVANPKGPREAPWEKRGRCWVSQRPRQELCFLVSDSAAGPENHLGSSHACACTCAQGTQKHQIWVLSSLDSQAHGISPGIHMFPKVNAMW